VAAGKRKWDNCNENWESDIADYDEICRERDKEFYRKHLVISQSGSTELTEEENEVLVLYLNGVTCEDIATQHDVETEVVVGLLEVIRSKLSLT